MTQPWLSVLIPTYNGETYLASALDSIIAQGDINIECIVIDDGSNDRTFSILNDYQDKLPLKIIQRERQGNWVANTNYALSVATAEYVCFLHQDDLWLNDRLEIMKHLIDENPQINLFLHSSQFIDVKGNFLGLWQCPLPSSPFLIDANLITKRLLIQNFIPIPAPIFKREIALNVGGLDEKLWYTADWDFWLKLASSGKTLYYPKPLSAFRIHSNSQTILRSSYLQEFQEQLEIVLKRYLEIWEVPNRAKKTIGKIANFSIEVNTTLAGLIHGQKFNLVKLLISFLSLGLSGCYQYLRDSRIWERVSARLKAQLTTNTKKNMKKYSK
jgi:glycosyltransferase involved in cell wall biosynthesis